MAQEEILYIENVDEEIEIEVSFDFNPPEKMTRHYPGSDASCEICEVVRTDNGAELFLLPEEQERLEEVLLEKTLEKLEEQAEYKKYGYMWRDI